MLPPADEGAGDESAQRSRPRRVALDATAGALAGAVSRFVISPLDVIKIRLQVQLEPVSSLQSGPGKRPSHYTGFLNAFRTIAAEEGIRGLWNGTVPGLLLTIPYTAVQFVALQQCKETAARLGWDGKSSTAVSFTSGALAGAAATVASYPFDLLRTTLAAQGEPKVYRGMMDAASSIVASQGLPGLYRGLGVTLIEIMPYAALQFGLYDAFNQAWEGAARARRARQQQGMQQQQQQHGQGVQQQASGKQRGVVQQQQAAQQQQQGLQQPPLLLSAGGLGAVLGAVLDDRKVQAFSCGLAAGLLAKLGSHPLDVAKKRYQVAGLQRSLRYGARVERQLAATPLLACLADIYAAEGVAGLWKGSVPSIIKAAPAAAITFTAYEALVGLLLAWADGGAARRGGGCGGGASE